jgi:hypothetical protein
MVREANKQIAPLTTFSLGIKNIYPCEKCTNSIQERNIVKKTTFDKITSSPLVTFHCIHMMMTGHLTATPMKKITQGMSQARAF